MTATNSISYFLVICTTGILQNRGLWFWNHNSNTNTYISVGLTTTFALSPYFECIYISLPASRYTALDFQALHLDFRELMKVAPASRGGH